MDVGVIGLGLIGGSIARALSTDLEVVGFDLNPDSAKAAYAARAVSHLAGGLQDFSKAKIIFVAVPPLACLPVLEDLAPHIRKNAVVTDCAGVKGHLFRELPESLRPHFVGGHPMAGKESGGFTHSTAELFEGRAWILTPSPETETWCTEMVSQTVETFGSRPVVMDMQEHDRLVALVSQLPHVLAAALVTHASRFSAEGLTAGSWADLTRVAGSDPGLWTDLCMLNDQELAHVLGRLIIHLQEFQEHLEGRESAAIREYFEKARQAKINS